MHGKIFDKGYMLSVHGKFLILFLLKVYIQFYIIIITSSHFHIWPTNSLKKQECHYTSD